MPVAAMQNSAANAQVPARKPVAFDKRVLKHPRVRQFNREFFFICKLDESEKKIGVDSGFWRAHGGVSNSDKVDGRFSSLAKSATNFAFTVLLPDELPEELNDKKPDKNSVSSELLAISLDGAMNVSKESLRANTLRYVFLQGARNAVKLYQKGKEGEAVALINNLIHFFKAEREIPAYLQSELLPVIKSRFERVKVMVGRTLLDVLPEQVRGVLDDSSNSAGVLVRHRSRIGHTISQV